MTRSCRLCWRKVAILFLVSCAQKFLAELHGTNSVVNCVKPFELLVFGTDGEPPRYVRALHFSYKLSPPEDVRSFCLFSFSFFDPIREVPTFWCYFGFSHKAKAFFAAVGTKESLQELFSSLRQSFARQVLR